MTEIERRANKKSLHYDKKYSEDRTLKDMLSRPQSFVEGAIEGIVNLLRQKAYRDGYINGVEESTKELREKLTDAKEVWFFTYWEYRQISSFAFERTRLLSSKNYDSFEEAWKAHEEVKFPASPVMKGYVKE